MIGQSTAYGRSSWQGGGEICLAPSRLRIARSILRQVGGSRGCVHGFPSTIDDVSAHHRHILVGESEYVDGDGDVAPMTLDDSGNGDYDWKHGRFETLTLIGHTWHGMWFQMGNDQDGGCKSNSRKTFSEGEGRWWYSRIGADHTPTQRQNVSSLEEDCSSEAQRYATAP